MKRFLRYSLEHGRRIRAMLLLDGKLKQQPVTVLAFTDSEVTLLIGQKKEPVILPLDQLLSCDYARGDRGEE